jgi:hypothetical protein
MPPPANQESIKQPLGVKFNVRFLFFPQKAGTNLIGRIVTGEIDESTPPPDAAKTQMRSLSVA